MNINLKVCSELEFGVLRVKKDDFKYSGYFRHYISNENLKLSLFFDSVLKMVAEAI